MATIFVHTRSIADILREYAPTSATLSPKMQRQVLQQYRQAYLQRQFPHFQVAIDANGKPFCQNHCVFFNHSHSQTDYSLAYSTDIPHLGIDIENLHRQANFKALAQRYFHPDEQHFWQQQAENPNAWFKIWTAKEAVLKACGLGIRMQLNQLNTQDLQSSQADFSHLFHAELGHFYLQHQQLEQSMLCLAIYRTNAEKLMPICVEYV